jgi:hypothetical protein
MATKGSRNLGEEEKYIGVIGGKSTTDLRAPAKRPADMFWKKREAFPKTAGL